LTIINLPLLSEFSKIIEVSERSELFALVFNQSADCRIEKGGNVFAQFNDRGWVVMVATQPIKINLDIVRARMPRGRRGGEPTSEQIAGVALPGHANDDDQNPQPGIWYAVAYQPDPTGRGRGHFTIGDRAEPPPDWFVWQAQQTRAAHVLATWRLVSPPGLQRATNEGAKEFPCAFKPRPCYCAECNKLRAQGQAPLHADL